MTNEERLEYRRGGDMGRRQRKADKADGSYPRPGLPISERNPAYDRGYRRAYYQSLIAPRSGKVKITPLVDRELVAAIGRIDGATQSAAFELGAWILAKRIDQQLLTVFGDRLTGQIENIDGSSTLIAGQSSYTAATPFEALLLLMLSQPEEIFD